MWRRIGRDEARMVHAEREQEGHGRSGWWWKK